MKRVSFIQTKAGTCMKWFNVSQELSQMRQKEWVIGWVRYWIHFCCSSEHIRQHHKPSHTAQWHSLHESHCWSCLPPRDREDIPLEYYTLGICKRFEFQQTTRSLISWNLPSLMYIPDCCADTSHRTKLCGVEQIRFLDMLLCAASRSDQTHIWLFVNAIDKQKVKYWK